MGHKRILLVAFVLLLLPAGLRPAPAQAPAQTAAGWTTEVAGKNVTMTPTDLAAGEFYRITIYPRESLGGAPITEYVDGFADREVAALGTPLGKAEPAKARDHSAAVAARGFVAARGQAREAAIFTALSVDGGTVRVVGVIGTFSILQRYQAQALAVTKEMRRQEEAAAKEGGRGLKTEALPPTPPGMTPGGKLVPGIYAGNAVRSDNGEIATRFRLYLYASGECRVCNEKGEEYRFGPDTYSYDSITGKLDVSQTVDIYNSVLGSDDAFSLYGRDADGKPYLYARSNRGFEYVTATLRYAGPPDRPSPKQAEAAKAAAEAEAARYKYVTAPGKGVQPAQVAGIVHSQTLRPGPGASSKNECYLLLKDGTVHDGLPVPPDELDVPLSRRREPEKWGRWRRQGAKVVAAWPDQPTRFVPLPGVMATPAKAGEQLAGRFGTGESSGFSPFGGSYRLWGVTFTPGGRFAKDKRGGSSSGSLGETMNGFSVDSTYDDNGSVTSFSSPGAVGYAARKKGSSRAGTYTISGYTMTLRYDSGKVERIPFFFAYGKRDQIYFEGATLVHDDGK